MKDILAIGLMSGTSLDGLDIALCRFSESEPHWDFEILKAETIPYTGYWKLKLSSTHHSSARDFWQTHVEYGHFLGDQVNRFLALESRKPDLVCSHGHTIFHQPTSGFTMQLGAGEAIAAETGLPVVADLRSADVALGGQGAPLVPVGDRLLFGQYGACLNIGGFTNVSFEIENRRIAFDVCPSNIILNHLAERTGKKFDQDGILASQGNLLAPLAERLSEIPYYSQKPPKSLGREWLEKEFLPVLESGSYSVSDLLRTMVEHIAQQIGQSLDILNKTTVLVTGGGAHNRYLVDAIRKHSHHDFFLPAEEIIDFKEALVFAFLGALRLKGKINVFSSVTGCKYDHSGGAFYALNTLLTKN
jgi:anhydro-N-acetylmuramic acid kinase